MGWWVIGSGIAGCFSFRAETRPLRSCSRFHLGVNCLVKMRLCGHASGAMLRKFCAKAMVKFVGFNLLDLLICRN